MLVLVAVAGRHCLPADADLGCVPKLVFFVVYMRRRVLLSVVDLLSSMVVGSCLLPSCPVQHV